MSDLDLDRELRRALRDAPAEASEGFTRRVLTRLEERPRPPVRLPATAWLPRPAFAAIALVLFLVGGAAGVLVSRQNARVAQERQRAELLDEYRALELELDELRRLASEQTPVLYLGGDETFDLVYDLADYQAGRSGEAVRPASLKDDR